MLKSGARLSILDVTPADLVFEDGLPGVEGRRSEPIGMVLGDDRLGEIEAARAHGAGVIVADLGGLLHSS